PRTAISDNTEYILLFYFKTYIFKCLYFRILLLENFIHIFKFYHNIYPFRILIIMIRIILMFTFNVNTYNQTFLNIHISILYFFSYILYSHFLDEFLLM